MCNIINREADFKKALWEAAFHCTSETWQIYLMAYIQTIERSVQ